MAQETNQFRRSNLEHFIQFLRPLQIAVCSCDWQCNMSRLWLLVYVRKDAGLCVLYLPGCGSLPGGRKERFLEAIEMKKWA